EAGQAVRPTQRADAVAPAGQDLVGIGLVADVPDQLVVRRIEHVVESDGKLDHAETCAKMTSRHGDRIDGLLAQFRRKLLQLMAFERAQVLGRLDAVKQGRRIFGVHWHLASMAGRMRRINAKYLYRPAAELATTL